MTITQTAITMTAMSWNNTDPTTDTVMASVNDEESSAGHARLQ